MAVDPLTAYEDELCASLSASRGVGRVVAPVAVAGSLAGSAVLVWAVSEVVVRVGRVLGFGGSSRGGDDGRSRRPPPPVPVPTANEGTDEMDATQHRWPVLGRGHGWES